jgi:hypothetical protein
MPLPGAAFDFPPGQWPVPPRNYEKSGLGAGLEGREFGKNCFPLAMITQKNLCRIARGVDGIQEHAVGSPPDHLWDGKWHREKSDLIRNTLCMNKLQRFVGFVRITA